jgi:F0F1-type ATP synthase membrane subunit a
VFGLVPLLILEVAVSVIQVYVFLVIFCMFLADTFGHHFRH